MRSYLEDVDFETIKERFDAFWEREVLDRPLIRIKAPRAKRKKIDSPIPESVEKRWTDIDYVLSKIEAYFENTCFLGDALPWYQPNLGPDSFTAFLGADLTFKSEETSWAKPFLEDLSGYEPVFKEDNRWWKIMDDLLEGICKAAEGNFLVVVPDLHYGADSLVATVGAQKLIRYLFTEPEEVKRLVRKLTGICLDVFDRYYEKISRAQKGSMLWTEAYSRGRSLVLQDDFSGLVSPKMFEGFFIEEQVTLAKHLDNSMFHLDGPMALTNLDRLLEIEELDGIQWVPGAGAKPMSEWIDVCEKVLNGNKCLQVYCRPGEVEFLLSRLRHGGLLICTYCRTEKEGRTLLKMVERYHKKG